MTLGISLQLAGQFFGASSYTAEEKLMGDCDELDPTLLIGWEGLWATVMWIVILPIMQFIKCSNENMCSNGVIEDTAGVFRDYAANPWLILQSFYLAFFTLVININGVTITKYGSAA
jgi:hypothetical protein